MKKIGMILAALVCAALLAAGCKSKDPQKAQGCLKSATASMDTCQACCKDAGYNGASWTSENCRCM